MTNDILDINADYRSFEIDGIVCDKWEIFQLMIEKYIAENRIQANNYAMIGSIYAAVTDYVNSTYCEEKAEHALES